MDKYIFDYTLSPEVDDEIFNDDCIKLDKQFSDIKKKVLILTLTVHLYKHTEMKTRS